MRRWTSTYWFSWTPVITFNTRRYELLRWVEENLEPVAFTDGPDHVGLALLDPNVRLSVTRSGMQLEDRVAVGSGVSSLLPAIRGVWDIMTPKSAVLEASTITWSEDVPEIDYHEARARFAQGLSGLGGPSSDLRAVDASGLMDIESVDSHGQVEWGIVSPPEFAERLANPNIGRTDSTRAGVSINKIDVSDLPRASVFVETHVHRVHVPPIDDVPGIESSIESVTSQCESVAVRIADTVVKRIREKS